MFKTLHFCIYKYMYITLYCNKTIKHNVGIYDHYVKIQININSFNQWFNLFSEQEFPAITHSFDTWHGAKNFGKRLAGVCIFLQIVRVKETMMG